MAVVVFFVSSILSVFVLRFNIPVKATPLMFIRTVQQISKGEEIKWHHSWVPLDSMSAYLPLAVIASEDQKFLSHRGFDTDAIQQAVQENLEGKRRRGGSTITQQTAKNVFLWPSSSWLRKGLEAYFTVLIETFWSKRRIMEVYLNSIEMGDGIYGAEAVAAQNFSCTALQLRRSDCALIAATLPNPRKYSSREPSSYMYKRQRWIMRQMKNLPKLNWEE